MQWRGEALDSQMRVRGQELEKGSGGQRMELRVPCCSKLSSASSSESGQWDGVYLNE